MLGKLRAEPAGELVGFAAPSVGSWLLASCSWFGYLQPSNYPTVEAIATRLLA
jgi:hypothetical protein